jgi:hypothetical protein
MLFKKWCVTERTAANLAALDQPIDLTQPGTFPLDRKKADWPANKEDGDALWTRRLRLDMLSELLGEDTRTGKTPKDATLPEIAPAKTQEAAARPEEALRERPYLPRLRPARGRRTLPQLLLQPIRPALDLLLPAVAGGIRDRDAQLARGHRRHALR